MKINLCKLREYLGDLFREERNTLPDEFSSCDVKTRHLSPGGLFIAFDDEENDGIEHIPAAIAAGAAAIATTLDFSELPPEARGLGYIRIDRPTLFAARAAELFAGFPADKLKLYAVTGTNGKTTSAMLLHTLLQNHFGSAGLISTVGCDTGREFRQTGYTTPPPFEVERLFNEMLANGIPAAALENSSHGLDQYRTASAKFEAAIFTNLTGDHLDYHHTMDNYFSAKRRMFLELVKPEGAAVINIDDPWGKLLLEQTREHGVRAIGFGRSEQADFRIMDVCCSAANSIYKIAGGDRDHVKRGPMGAAAAEGADVVVVTDDNPRSEDPASIRAAILQACPEATEVGDRAEAILRGVDALGPGDALLIAGKGHETGQVIAGDIFPFDDVEQASIAVAALDGVI